MRDRAAWFKDARYGMFIHWGVYSALGRGEWVRNRDRIPHDQYTQFAKRFRAQRYDARAWARLARESGMTYMCLTTKHHDGYCLFDTKTTPFNAVQVGPGRDLVREFVDACRAEGLRICLYFSLMDWSHPLCLPDPRMYYWDGEQIEQFGFRQPLRSNPKFIAYLKAQITELLTHYGKIDVLWHDGTWAYDAKGWHIKQLNDYARSIQPHLLFTDRAHRKEDIASCEQHISATEDSAWEACMTLNDSWGYVPTDNNWKDPRQVVLLLLQVAAKRGCLLLNMGPRADGTMPAKGVRILKAVGRWVNTYAEALYKVQCSPFSWHNLVATTVSGNRLYLHVKCWPGTELRYGGLKNRIRRVVLLPDERALEFEQSGDNFTIRGLPARSPDPLMPVIRVETAGPPRAC